MLKKIVDSLEILWIFDKGLNLQVIPKVSWIVFVTFQNSWTVLENFHNVYKIFVHEYGVVCWFFARIQLKIKQ